MGKALYDKGIALGGGAAPDANFGQIEGKCIELLHKRLSPGEVEKLPSPFMKGAEETAEELNEAKRKLNAEERPSRPSC